MRITLFVPGCAKTTPIFGKEDEMPSCCGPEIHTYSNHKHMYAVVLQVAITCTCRYSLWLSFRLGLLLLAAAHPSTELLAAESDATAAAADDDDVISIVVFAPYISMM